MLSPMVKCARGPGNTHNGGLSCLPLCSGLLSTNDGGAGEGCLSRGVLCHLCLAFCLLMVPLACMQVLTLFTTTHTDMLFIPQQTDARAGKHREGLQPP